MIASKKKKGWIILGVAALLLLIFFITQYNKQRFDWRLNFNDESKEPYGTLAVKKILKQHFGGANFTVLDKKIAKSLPENWEGNSNYVFIGDALLLDTNDVDVLLDFADAGNTVFISSLSIPYLLMDEVFLSPCDTLYWEGYFYSYDTMVMSNFVHPDLKDTSDFVFKYVNKNQVKSFDWCAFGKYSFCESENYPIIISQSPDSVVSMAMFPYGDGAFYLQTNPIAFTNYFLTKERGQQYADKVFSHLQKGTVYWDDFTNLSRQGRNNYNNPRAENSLKPKDGPLDYLLSQPPLAWAWYLLLSLALLYLLFRAKRRQRMIPVLEKNRNTSLEFISTIGRLHFSGQNHRRIALQKTDLLFSFIRSNYKLSSKEMEDDFAKKLSIVSEIDESLIQKILLIHTNIQSSTFISDKTLIELHKLIHYFYKNCR